MADRNKPDRRKKPTLIPVQVVDENGKPTGMKTVNMDDVRATGRKKSTLSPQQIERAKALWDRVGSTARSDLDKDGWVTMFTHEQDPENELRMWSAIASTVEGLWQDSKFSKQLMKTSLLRAVLSASMNMVDIPSQCQGITDEHVAVIREKLDAAIAQDSQGET